MRENDPVKLEMDRLRNKCGLQFELEFIEENLKEDEILIIFHNIQSINNKMELISTDLFYQSGTIIILNEALYDNRIFERQ